MKRLLHILLILAALVTATSVSSFAAPNSSVPVSGLVISPVGLPEQIIEHTGFTVSYNCETLSPNWSAWTLTKDRVSSKVVSRTDEIFQSDPSATGPVAITQDYTGNGYDRGHMAPAADMRYDATAMTESFYLSNICPQDHTLNEATWCDLEKKCRYWAYRYEPIYIICGPLYSENPKTIGTNGVAVPDRFFKVICKFYKDKPSAIGFLFPNEPCTDDFMNYAVSVSDIEKLTNLTFFPGIKDLDKKNFNPKYWN